MPPDRRGSPLRPAVMTRHGDSMSWLNLVNAALLAIHEIDSACWQEWTMFRLPGGIQIFLVLNLALLFIVFYGFDQVIRRRRGHRYFSYLLAGSGIFAFSAHAAFLLAGYAQFRRPVSIGLLAATLVVSAMQISIVSKHHPVQ